MSKNELLSLALIYGEPRHAYALNAIIKEVCLEHWAHISQASIYNTLNRLAEARCVEVSTERVGNNPERKVYSITETGRERLRQELREALVTPTMGDNPFYLAVMFTFGLPVEEVIALLEQRIERLEGALEHMARERVHLEEVGAKQAVIMLDAAAGHVRVESDAARRFMDLLRAEPGFYEETVTRQLREMHNSERSSHDE